MWPVFFIFCRNPQDFGKLFRVLLARAVVGCQCLKDVGDGHDFGGNGHFIAGKPVGIAFAVDAFMVGAGIFDDFGQFFGERQRLDVSMVTTVCLVDFFPFFLVDRYLTDFGIGCAAVILSEVVVLKKAIIYSCWTQTEISCPPAALKLP